MNEPLKTFLHIECSREQKALWNSRARSKGMKLDAWVKMILDTYAQKPVNK